MKIAVGGISHETNTFSPLTTGPDLFRVARGEEVVQGVFWDRWRQQGVELVPTLTAGASPHGMVQLDAYRTLKEELLSRLERSLPVDGVFLSLHGAMEVEAIDDGESDLTREVRARVGPNIPIVASLDLHGNIAPAFVEAADLLTALRTAPHRDGEETRRRAFDHLVRCVRDGVRPQAAMVKLPLVLPGEHAVTEVEPARSLYQMLADVEAVPGIMDASLMIGCAWTDSPHTAVSALVMAESDRLLAHQVAGWLAQTVWEERRAFQPDTEALPPEVAVCRALACPERPVFISDSGDNVTAGGAGDLPLFVELLLAAGASDAVVTGLADAQGVALCASVGVGAWLTLSLGGKLDRQHGQPLEVSGTVRHLDPSDDPTLAVLQVEGVTVVLTSDRRAFPTAASFQRAGLDPARAKVIVVKLGYLFPELRQIAARSIMALSPGYTDLRLERLPYRRLARPIYPLDRNVAWQPPIYSASV
jgi:microcystin degradation protein MlrC